VSPQAVSAQVSQLESWLCVRLFHRTTRRMSLTDEGRLYLEHCRSGMQLIEQGERDLRDRRDEVAGKLRVVASPSLGQVLVAPLVASFCSIHPGLQVELLTQSHFPDLVDSSIDMGVIGGELPSSSLVARRAGRFTHLLCASPAYLLTHGTPVSPYELTQHRCVGLRHPRTGRVWPWTFQQGSRVVTLEPPLIALTQDPSVQRQLVLHGAGIAQIADYFARPLLRDGSLVELPLHYCGPKIDVHVFLPRRTQVPKRTRLLSDHMWDGLRQALIG
jgi:LysR family transcriptional regulator for bpeEF and oprC